jgi:CRISPR-associated protein (TIGR03986 family)
MPDKYRMIHNLTFVNPYNFVKLDGGCVRDINCQTAKEDSGALTGWLECHLQLKSPIFIPNSSNNDYFQKRAGDKAKGPKSYEFFSYEDLAGKTGDPAQPPSAPVIPGSELRGMIRSAFEALTNSCLFTSDIDRQLYKRAPKSNMSGKPGILRKNGNNWEIQPCDRYMIKTKDCSRDPFPLPSGYAKWDEWRHHLRCLEKGNSDFWISSTEDYVTVGKYNLGPLVGTYSETCTSGMTKGHVHVTARFQRKHHDSVFVENGSPAIPISAGEAQNYLDNLKLYLKNEEYKSEYEHLNKGDDIDSYERGVCVYYAEYGGMIYLSPSMITREVFYNRLSDLLGTYKPCTDPDALCPACSLFGMVSDQGALASRLRFSDAKLVEGCKPQFETPKYLDELASPKSSATEFYLKKPSSAELWNYDYAFNWMRNRGGKITNNVDANTIDRSTPMIRGRKFYWHQPSVKYSDLNDVRIEDLDEEQKKKLERLVFVRPLKEAEFKFRIYFNRVCEDDLKRLIWVLTIGNSDEHAHKIGMGKPLGLGSVQIRVKKRYRRTIGKNLEYQLIDDPGENQDKVGDLQGDDSLLQSSQEAKNQFMAISKLNNDFGNTIRYPYVKDQNNGDLPENYLWFVCNKCISGKSNAPVIEHELPQPDNPRLPVFIQGKFRKRRNNP